MLSLNWLLIIPILGFLVFVHELGHFIMAKRFGIKVTEFGFGFPPRLFGVRWGETIYSINAIPLGGFVRMVGEEDPTEPRSFARQARL
ncbi:MAG: site-2 protease family protein [Chloroflexi bacterium]|nr:site-2 protease family protein [Chloroflexota bacterium]